MEHEYITLHRRKITRNYLRALSNLIKLGRLTEAATLTARFRGIIELWAIQQENMQQSAIKDGSEKQRMAFIKK